MVGDGVVLEVIRVGVVIVEVITLLGWTQDDRHRDRRMRTLSVIIIGVTVVMVEVAVVVVGVSSR